MIQSPPSEEPEHNNILPYVSAEHMQEGNDRLRSARMFKEQMPPWWQNSHAIQQRFADLILTSAADQLGVDRNEIGLVPGDASWLNDSQEHISFVVVDTKNKKWLLTATIQDRTLDNIRIVKYS